VALDKQEIRERIWKEMEERNIARFPRPVQGRIPNFVGAEEAAEKLRGLSEWKDAKVIKSNPDSPQRPVRENALKEGKIVYMAVPRLRELKCFIELDPRFLGGSVSKASTIKGAFKHGRQVHPKEMKKVDLVVAGSVAVDRDGGRVGKGGGFSDLEFGIGRNFGLIDDETPVVSTVHPLQVLESRIDMRRHDVPLSIIVTRSEIISTDTTHSRPTGIIWDILDSRRMDNIPILTQLKQNYLP
jgi:5-formyltetrahydrofolate cyclo-ligase